MDSINLLPGPVEFINEIHEAFNEPALSHRDGHTKELVNKTEQLFNELTGAKHATIFVGSGTLSNDAVAAQIACIGGKGLIPTNGKFGEKMGEHLAPYNLDYDMLKHPWGEAFDYKKIETIIKDYDWCWFAHCDTSSGVLNDLTLMVEICKKHNVKLCVDCVSTMGTMAIDLKNVYLASCVSTKGVASYEGLGIVLSNQIFTPRPDKIPMCLDIGYYQKHGGIPFTLSSRFVSALNIALEHILHGKRLQNIAEYHRMIADFIENKGWNFAVKPESMNIAVNTIAIPANLSAKEIGNSLKERGILVYYESEYYYNNNWVQACLFSSNLSHEHIVSFLRALDETTAK